MYMISMHYLEGGVLWLSKALCGILLCNPILRRIIKPAR